MSKELDRIMRQMKGMGVTISVTPASGAEKGFEDRPSGIIAAAAKRNGMYYGDDTKENQNG